jgi:hypothetical protein
MNQRCGNQDVIVRALFGNQDQLIQVIAGLCSLPR